VGIDRDVGMQKTRTETQYHNLRMTLGRFDMTVKKTQHEDTDWTSVFAFLFAIASNT
jgi:hypothetical protein